MFFFLTFLSPITAFGHAKDIEALPSTPPVGYDNLSEEMKAEALEVELEIYGIYSEFLNRVVERAEKRIKEACKGDDSGACHQGFLTPYV